MLKNTINIFTGIFTSILGLALLLVPMASLGASIAGTSGVAGLGFTIAVSDVPANTELELKSSLVLALAR